MQAKAFIDDKVMEFMRLTDPNAHFSANLIEKEKWTLKECEETVTELITFLKIRALKAEKLTEKFLKEKRRIEKKAKNLPEQLFKG